MLLHDVLRLLNDASRGRCVEVAYAKSIEKNIENQQP
jgi:hypothetical protein